MTGDSLEYGARTLLEGYPEAQATLHELTALLRAGRLRRYEVGEDLCAEGEPSQHLFIVLEGTVHVSREGTAGERIALFDVAAPTLLGQMGIIDRARRTATCSALAGPVIAATLDRELFRTLIRGTDGRGIALRRLLLTSLTRQLNEGNSRLRSLVATGDDALMGTLERGLR